MGSQTHASYTTTSTPEGICEMNWLRSRTSRLVTNSIRPPSHYGASRQRAGDSTNP